MKIGIITFWQTKDNYGQVLQGYALQTFLKSLGHNPFIIRYNHDGREIFKKYRVLRKIFKAILILPLIKYLKSRKATKELNALTKYNNEKNEQRHFNAFREKHFMFSERVYNSLSDLKKLCPGADMLIAGSDQIWGKSWLLNKKENRVFYLDFGSPKIKRISYAPSFGMTSYPDSCKKELSRQLNNFNLLSTREQAGVKICQEAGHKATWVCDPTLLLFGEDYIILFNATKKESNTIFIYCLNIQTEEDIFWDEITMLAKQVNLHTIVTIGSGYIPAIELFEKAKYDYSTIGGWLQNIHNANFVVTTSFHGVMFCLLFHTKFAFVPLKGTHSSSNNRVIEILDLLGMKQHIVENGEDINKIYRINIDWVKTDQLINEFREKSRRFLIDGISN